MANVVDKELSLMTDRCKELHLNEEKKGTDRRLRRKQRRPKQILDESQMADGNTTLRSTIKNMEIQMNKTVPNTTPEYSVFTGPSTSTNIPQVQNNAKDYDKLPRSRKPSGVKRRLHGFSFTKVDRINGDDNGPTETKRTKK